MSDFLHETRLTCPWCGSPTEHLIDCSAGSQTLVEDCQVCCSPILIHTDCDDLTGELHGLSATRENE